MSRIIVKNLPNKISEAKLKEIFSEKGVVTDIQLKYTPDGKFRHFGFIGFQSEEQAQAALEAFDKTFVNASQIQVELCQTLAEQKKKVRKEKNALKQSDTVKTPEPAKKKKEKPKNIKDAKVAELIESHKDDTLFKEFMEVHLPDRKELWAEEEKDSSDEQEVERGKDADKNISDIDYIKKKKTLVEEDKQEKVDVKAKHSKPFQIRFTVKVCDLPYKFKKSELKEFFQPLKLASFRIPKNVKGIAYCDFATEKERKLALNKHRSFFKNNRVIVKIFDKSSSDKQQKWGKEEQLMKDVESIAESGRIFVRNLAYTVLQDELKALFEKFGPITNVTLPVDPLTRKLKGFGFVTFLIPEHACKAFNELDGTVFHGRMLHLIPGRPKEEADEDDDDTGLSFKEKKLKKQKSMANNKINWNSFFINENCLTEAMAETYKTSKENVLSDEKGGAAVRLALGETEMVQKTKDYLVQNGVLLEAFENMSDAVRSDTVILVKNLPFKTEIDEIRSKFVPFGELSLVLLSPYGGTAIVEFIEPSEAFKAFKKLAYTKFKHIPLYLEWAPKNIFDGRKKTADVAEKPATEDRKTENESKEEPHIPVEGATLYVKGINFSTTSDVFKQHFESCGKIVSAIVAEKRDPKNPQQKLSMGYGFVEFADKQSADKALKTLQFSSLDGHMIELKRSNRTTTAATSSSRPGTKKGKPTTKMVVRNIPFQATEKEVRALFKVFGEIKSLRLPKKMVGTGSHRGFCFVEFQNIHDAKRAFKALSESTHLYGRRLVLEWAEADDDVDNLRKKVAQTFTGSVKDKEVKKKNIDLEDLPMVTDY